MNTRIRVSPAAIRLGAAALVLAVALPLSACLNPFDLISKDPSTPKGPTSAPSTGSAAPTDEPTSSGSGALWFEDPSLPAGTKAEWSDGLMTDSGWTVAKPDDGKGHWSYSTVDGVCTAQFWQGTGPFTGADDRDSSDELLVGLITGDAPAIKGAARDTYWKDASTGGLDVGARAVTGGSDGASWVIQTRAFKVADVGFYIVLDCTDGSASTVIDEVIDKDPILVH